MRELTMHDVAAAVKGGSVFASGGGGWVDHGMTIGTAAMALGRPKLASVEELADDAIIVTTTAIGAPAGTSDWQMLGKDYIKTVQLLQENFDGKIVGLMTPQNGMSSSINGWLPAAALDLVVVDATGDMRAHPTGKMGSLGLASNLEYQTIQVVVGGKVETGSYIELVVKGTTAKTSNILRVASDMSGGFIACARHPLPTSYVKQHAALGGITRAIDLGRVIMAAEAEGASAVVEAICRQTHGEVVGEGRVAKVEVKYQGAFDIGTITVDTPRGALTLHVMNEYMAVSGEDDRRFATFPDVIATISSETGSPISAGNVTVGMNVIVFKVDKQSFPLSSSVRDPSVYPEVEQALKISLWNYVKDDFLPFRAI